MPPPPAQGRGKKIIISFTICIGPASPQTPGQTPFAGISKEIRIEALGLGKF
jgi:hypothetical protein